MKTTTSTTTRTITVTWLLLSLFHGSCLATDSHVYLSSNRDLFKAIVDEDIANSPQHELGPSLHRTPHRELFTIPDYTSPPTRTAIRATPGRYKSDLTIDYAREVAEIGSCGLVDPLTCQIPFYPRGKFDESTTKLGVLFYGGALVDPRSYSPIAKVLSEDFGLYVSIPIFDRDLAFDGCGSERIELARLAFPNVEKWIVAGHSYGVIAASRDAWDAITTSSNTTSNEDEDDGSGEVAGIVAIGGTIRGTDCGENNFTQSSLPAASVLGTLDGLIPEDTIEPKRKAYMSQEHSFFMTITGGNHGQFGSYDDSERKTILGQIDGNSTIPEEVQQDLTIGAILHVVSRSGLPLPSKWKKAKMSKKKKGGKKRG